MGKAERRRRIGLKLLSEIIRAMSSAYMYFFDIVFNIYTAEMS